MGKRASQAEEIVCAKALGQEEQRYVVGIKQTGAQGFWGRASGRSACV